MGGVTAGAKDNTRPRKHAPSITAAIDRHNKQTAKPS
jgi:hypothetical protein